MRFLEESLSCFGRGLIYSSAKRTFDWLQRQVDPFVGIVLAVGVGVGALYYADKLRDERKQDL